MKRILICGSGGFIGGHLTQRLKSEGNWVRGVDLKKNEFDNDASDEFIFGDLRDPKICMQVGEDIDEVYQLAADMGGAGYLFIGDNDADIMHNSVLINLNILDMCRKRGISKIFYSSSACVYPEYNQMDPENPNCEEGSVYPAQPDSEYGWEKLFSERLYLSYAKNYGIDVRIARFHNIFGPMGTWKGGKEKAPAAICRKVAIAEDGSYIEVWGSGNQTRSFLYIDECIEAVRRFMESSFQGPVNIGSDYLISIRDFTELIIGISGKSLEINHVSGPLGVHGRNSDNRLINEKLGWRPSMQLKEGITKTYNWINAKVKEQK
jgi:nucleoside-diphosphate-sugar epimerase